MLRVINWKHTHLFKANCRKVNSSQRIPRIYREEGEKIKSYRVHIMEVDATCVFLS